jgi:hypothetical protein
MHIVCRYFVLRNVRRIGYNVLQLAAGGLPKHPLSPTYKGYLKIQMFISERKQIIFRFNRANDQPIPLAGPLGAVISSRDT